MKHFADLYARIDRTTSTKAKVAALVDYFATAPPRDAAWALFFLTGRRLKRLLPTRLLHEWTIELTGLPEWLVREGYAVTGDFAEAIALLLDRRLQPLSPDTIAPLTIETGTRLPFDEPDVPAVDTSMDDVSLADWIERRILPLRELSDSERRIHVFVWWSRLDRWQLFVLNKLLTGEFRVGISHTLVVRALAQFAGLAPPVVEHRLMGNWEPSAAGAFAALVDAEGAADVPSQPFPFCLASPLEQPPNELGDRADWLVEWKWDGIRAQLIRRGGVVFLWSRGEELITHRFPEVVAAATALPDGTVLDGELLAFDGEAPRPFADLQQRIGRQRRVHEVAAGIPVVFVAYDVLEEQGVDVRPRPTRDRRAALVATVANLGNASSSASNPTQFIRISDALTAKTWEELATLRSESRRRGVEGLMLKRWSAPYHTGRRKGDWWKWKIEPHTIDAVLIYAQPGSGRRASLFTDYTFGVWDGEELVPVAKAYSGLTDAEIDELDRWVRRHTTERFGPVSAVEPVHVFELGFERIARSSRHRSGIAVRFPRMLRWRRDKTARDADTLETLTALLATQDDSLSRR